MALLQGRGARLQATSIGRGAPTPCSLLCGRSCQFRGILAPHRALLYALNASPQPDEAEELQRAPPAFLVFPEKQEASEQQDRPKPLVRVKLSVHYRVHSRQMLCIGGSQIPFGWSFLSIAKVPMTWNQGDIWTCEVRWLQVVHQRKGANGVTPTHPVPLLACVQVDLPAGQRIEYKYVILEEQVCLASIQLQC